MNKSTLSMLVFCLGGTQAAHAASGLDLQKLEVLGETRIPAADFHRLVSHPNSSGDYSSESITDGNYSSESITDDNYDSESITDANYDSESITDANYTSESITDGGALVSGAKIPTPHN